jgi:hypothetical protein
MAGDAAKCQCLTCQLERVVIAYCKKTWPVGMAGRPPEREIMSALTETLAVVAVLVAKVHEDRAVQRAAVDAALTALLKFRISITDEPELVNLETGESHSLDDLVATKH